MNARVFNVGDPLYVRSADSQTGYDAMLVTDTQPTQNAGNLITLRNEATKEVYQITERLLCALLLGKVNI